MKLHELKIKQEYLEAIRKGDKTFEIRKNDRDYQIGDIIYFNNTRKPEPSRENVFGYDPLQRLSQDRYDEKQRFYDQKIWEEYEQFKKEHWDYAQGKLFIITYVLKDCPEYGLDRDYCILSIKPLEVAK